MNAILLLIACGVFAGIPAALLVFATDSRFCGDHEAGDDDEYIYCRNKPDRRVAQLLRMEMTQAELYAYMTGEVAP